MLVLSFERRQLPTLPRSSRSTIGVRELNFCVRYGNRWDLSAIITAIVYYRLSPVISWRNRQIPAFPGSPSTVTFLFSVRNFSVASPFVESADSQLHRAPSVYSYSQSQTFFL